MYFFRNIIFNIQYSIFIIFFNFCRLFLGKMVLRRRGKGRTKGGFFSWVWGLYGVVFQITSIGIYIFIYETPITTPFWLPVKPLQPNPLNTNSQSPPYHPEPPILNKMLIQNPKFQPTNYPPNPKRTQQHNF